MSDFLRVYVVKAAQSNIKNIIPGEHMLLIQVNDNIWRIIQFQPSLNSAAILKKNLR